MMKQKILYIALYTVVFAVTDGRQKEPPAFGKSAGAHFRSKTLILFADLSMYDVLNKSQTYVRLHLEFVWRS